jgi:fibronectin-binding autotransporter adhesin
MQENSVENMPPKRGRIICRSSTRNVAHRRRGSRAAKLAVLGLPIALAVGGAAQADTLEWNPTVDGAWDLQTPNWNQGTWQNDSVALFDGNPPMDVIVSSQYGGVSASAIVFTQPFYEIDGDSLNLSGGSITVQGQTTINNVLTGSAGLIVDGESELTLGAANSYTGDTVILSDTTLQNGVDDAVSSGSNVTINPGASWDLNGSSNSIGSLSLSDSSSVFNINVLTLGGDVTSTGNSSINGTALDMGGSDRNFTVDGELDINAQITGSGALIKNDGGLLVLNSANTYSGDTIINGGTLQNGADNAVPIGSNVTVSSATWDLNSSSNTIGSLSLSDSSVVNVNTLTLGGDVTSTGNSSINGTALDMGGSDRNFNVDGELDINAPIVDGGALIKNNGGLLVLGYPSSYSGDTIINGGTLENVADVDDAVPSGSNVTITSAAWDLNGTSNTIGSLSLSDSSVDNVNTLTLSGDVTNSGNSSISGTSLDLGGAARNFTVAGELDVSAAIYDGSLTKTGGGKLALTAQNTFTGSTSVNGGVLELNASTGMALAGTSSITVNSGGTLRTVVADQINHSASLTLNANSTSSVAFDTNGTNQTLGSLTMTTASVMEMGDGSSVVQFAPSEANTWSGTLVVWDWSGTPITGGGTDQLIVGSDLLGLSTAQLAQIQFYSDMGSTYLGTGVYASSDDGEIVPDLATVPEPASLAIFGFVGVSLMRRRRRATMSGSM